MKAATIYGYMVLRDQHGTRLSDKVGARMVCLDSSNSQLRYQIEYGTLTAHTSGVATLVFLSPTDEVMWTDATGLLVFPGAQVSQLETTFGSWTIDQIEQFLEA